ncbi:unnamed protein product [Gordionus sp. m RMFG-2023]|uniref:glutamate-rich WD repeat-containing protein 1-like n=1 Tax=Gordionus sp. m RMFG-2023 TaxID=3053472 RepID=UPI0030E1FBF4
MKNKIKKSKNSKKNLKNKNAPKPIECNESDNDLECDESVYEILHNFTLASSCLSFNIIPDNLGNNRALYPLTGYIVAGTQGPHFRKNSLIVLKMENLCKTQKSSENLDNETSDSETEEETIIKTPKFESSSIHHEGGVNRLKLMQINEKLIVATWSESKKVHLWNINQALLAVNDSRYMHKYKNIDNSEYATKPIFTFGGHMEEGFALDWSPVKIGRLATGDNKSNIHLWNMRDDSTWHVDQIPYISHKLSVEDIQWSPSEADVFASCSVDRTIKIWDCRAAHDKACMLTATEAHDSDINVISWNKLEQFFLVSGADDGTIKIWDLREFKENKPMAVFKYHSGPITSVEWKPDESSVFAAASGDDKLTVWDLSLEKDEIQDPKTEHSANGDQGEPSTNPEIEELKAIEAEVPPYLLFVHQGQNEIKELHWHPQIPGLIIDTSFTGINIFKTINV